MAITGLHMVVNKNKHHKAKAAAGKGQSNATNVINDFFPTLM